MRFLNRQELLDLVAGVSIFSAGGGGDPSIGRRIVNRLDSDGFKVQLADSSDVSDHVKIVNFACVGATTTVEYNSEAAVRTLKCLEKYADVSAYAMIPVELGGFNTLVAVDVASRRGIPVYDGDGAGRSVPEVHLKVYTIDDIPLTPMVISDTYGKNTVIVKETADSRSAERIARILAAEWGQSVYTARRMLTGKQVQSSPMQNTLSKSIQIGKLLRTAEDPIGAILEKTGGFTLFEGTVGSVEQRTEAGFTFIEVELRGIQDYSGSLLELKAKNEVLVAYRDGKVVAISPDIITPVQPETGNCVTAEKIRKGKTLTVLGFPAPEKWRSSRGLELWREVLNRSNVSEAYSPIESIQSLRQK